MILQDWLAGFFVLYYFACFILFYLYPLDACSFSNEMGKGVDPDGREGSCLWRFRMYQIKPCYLELSLVLPDIWPNILETI